MLLRGRCFGTGKCFVETGKPGEDQMFLTTKPRLFCFSARSGKLELNISIKEIANVKYVTDKSFSFEDIVVGTLAGDHVQNNKTYYFRAAHGDVKMWVDTINSMIHYVNGEMCNVCLYQIGMSEEPENYFFAERVFAFRSLSHGIDPSRKNSGCGSHMSLLKVD